MPTRVFYVPLVLAIEADNRHVALAEATEIAERVAGEDRHLRKDVLIPALGDPFPDRLALPLERFLHRGIRV